MSDFRKYERYAKQIGLFKGLETEEVRDILHQGQSMKFQKGMTIFHEGQPGSSLFSVLSGNVGIYNGEMLIAICKAGDAFGEMSVLGHRPHSATAMAKTDVKLFTLDERELNDILHKGVAVRLLLNVIHTLSGHLADSNTTMAMQYRENKELKTRLEAVRSA